MTHHTRGPRPTAAICSRGHLAILLAAIAVAPGGCGDGPAAPPEAVGLRLDMYAVRLLVDRDTTVVATLHDSKGHVIAGGRQAPVTWTSSAPDVATVENGVIRAVGPGRALVTATAGSLPPATLEVQAQVPTSLGITPGVLYLQRGHVRSLTAVIWDQEGIPVAQWPAGLTVEWSTSDPTVASVEDGVLRAEGRGRAIIHVAAGDFPPGSAEVGVVPAYQAEALGRLGGSQSNAHAINNTRTVAGWSDVHDGRLFLWTESAGMSDALGVRSSARGLNDEGAVVGSYYHEHGFSAVVLRDGVRTELGTLPSVATHENSFAYRINNAGLVVGISDPGARAVVWRPSQDGGYEPPVYLGHRHPNRWPVVNNSGDVAFTAIITGNDPVLWRARPDGSYGEPLFLGRPAGGSYIVHEMNDAGLIVGFRWTGSVEMAVLWHPNNYAAPIDLGIGQAWGINNSGQIVGVLGGDLPPFGWSPRRPVLWEVDADGAVIGPFDIGTPAGFQYGGARAINDEGWIVGTSWGPAPIMATLWRTEP